MTTSPFCVIIYLWKVRKRVSILSFIICQEGQDPTYQTRRKSKNCVIKPCALALHIAKIQQLVRQLNKRRNTSEGIHLENHVVLPILSYIGKTKNTYYLESCLSYNYSHIVMIRDKKQQSVNYTMQSIYYSCGIHRFCIA